MLLLRKRLNKLLSVSEEVGVVFEQVNEVSGTSEVLDELRLLLGKPKESVTDFLFLLLERLDTRVADGLVATMVDCSPRIQISV